MQEKCPNKDLCGSCNWSNLLYEDQLKQKLSEINNSFEKNNLKINCENIIRSPKTSHYRNKMDFVINYQGLMGLREKGKWWKTIDNHKCFIADIKIEKVFDVVYKWLKTCNLTFYDRKSHNGLLRYAVIRSTSLGETMLILVTSETTENEKNLVKEQLELLAQNKEITTLVWSVNKSDNDVSYGDELITISGKGYITEEINGIKYIVSPNAFFQTNLFTTEILQSTVLEYAENIKDNTILDAYCGSGFFSLAFAKAGAKKVIGVEEVEQAIIDANKNAEINNITNTQFHVSDMKDFSWESLKPDIVVLDPSRAGLHPKVLEAIIKNKPKEIIYVSCNYKNFAKEFVELSKFYRVEKMTALDMFPHTPHVELVSKLTLI